MQGYGQGFTVTNLTVNGRCKDCILSKQGCRLFDQHVELEATSYKKIALDI